LALQERSTSRNSRSLVREGASLTLRGISANSRDGDHRCGEA
jgi:hypothetical protein